MALPGKIKKGVGRQDGGRGHGISRGIEEVASGNSWNRLKRTKIIYVEFPSWSLGFWPWLEFPQRVTIQNFAKFSRMKVYIFFGKLPLQI